MPRTGPEYNAAYAHWAGLRDTMRAIDAQAARARANLNAARPEFVARSESLRADLRHWQDSTYAGYDSVVDSMVRARHLQPVADTTGAVRHRSCPAPWRPLVDLFPVLGSERPERRMVLECARNLRHRPPRRRDRCQPPPLLNLETIMRVATSLLVLVSLAGPLRAQDPVAARTKGSPTAPVTVYEMSDFQCPFCAKFALEIAPALDAEYVQTGKVRWIFVNFPIPKLHPNAVSAAQVAMCAAKQNKFWQVHDLLFRNQKVWAPLDAPGEYLLTFADSASLDKPSFQECLTTGATRAEIESDAQAAVRSGANSTPSFYIEGGLLPGAQPVSVFRQILDSIYAVKTAPAK